MKSANKAGRNVRWFFAGTGAAIFGALITFALASLQTSEKGEAVVEIASPNSTYSGGGITAGENSVVIIGNGNEVSK
jgi:hypothetical protein